MSLYGIVATRIVARNRRPPCGLRDQLRIDDQIHWNDLSRFDVTTAAAAGNPSEHAGDQPCVEL
jgi:hypothetical protein